MKAFQLTLLICIVFTQLGMGQLLRGKINIDPAILDTFSFTKKFSYGWDIIDEGKGKLSTANERKLKASDRNRLYFTADCYTNVQGGYEIRYADARQSGDTLELSFADGLPAYASSFYVFVIGDSFYFKPSVVYPSYFRGQQYKYDTGTQVLTLNKGMYKKGEPVIGKIDIEFTELFSAPGQETASKNFFIRGVFRVARK